MSWIAIAGLAIAGASAGYAMSGAGQPKQPNLASSSRAMSMAQARLLPELRRLQAAAQVGGRTMRSGYTTSTVGAEDRAKLERKIANYETWLAGRSAQGQPAHMQQFYQGKLDQMKAELASMPEGGGTVYKNRKGKIVPETEAMIDFSGYSQADIQGAITRELAGSQLELSQKYDAEFIESALEQERLADPEGFAAREKLYELIQKQIGEPDQSPVAEEMDRQVKQRVAAGAGLTGDEQALLDQAVASGAAARGGAGPDADFSRELTTGFKGEQRRLENAGAGAAWLASGQTPEDIDYRRRQQILANLGSFIAGRSPQSQFASLSGAQQGPTPITTGGAPGLPTLDPNAGSLGAGSAVTRYRAQINQALAQPNPWMTGLTGTLGVLNAAGAGGWQPLATQSQRPSV